MAKVILIVVGVFAFISVVVHLEMEGEIDPIMLNAPWVILTLCAGFYGIIEAIEERKK